jgi:signal transduction histidine kinase
VLLRWTLCFNLDSPVAGVGRENGQVEVVSRRLLRGVAPAARPQAAAGSPAEPLWAAALAVVVVLILATDLLAPNHFGGGSLVVLPVLGASWILGRRALVAVVAVAALIELAGVVHGDLSWLMVAGRLLAVMVVAGVGRAAAIALAEVRRARQREVGTLLRSSQLMARQLDEAGVAAEAVRVAAGTLVSAGRSAVRRAVLLRVTDGRGTIMASQDHAGVSTSSGRQIGLDELPPAVRETLSGGRPAVLRTAELEPELRELALLAGADEWALARVQVAGQPYGVLAAAAGAGDGFHREDLRLLDGIARVTGLAVAAALQHAGLVQLQQRLQHSVELALEVGRSLDPAEVVDSILVRVSESVGADHATLARVNGSDLVIECTYRPDAGGRLVPRRRHFPPELVDGIPALARALASGQPVVGGPPKVAQGAEELGAELPHGPHTLTLPFVVDGRTACLLALGRGGERPFGAADLAQLEPMADVALLALRNADLHARTTRAQTAAKTYSGRLEQAIEAAEEIGSSDELGDVVERVLQRAVAVVHADQGSISRLEGEALVLEFDFDPTDSRRAPGVCWAYLSNTRLAAEAIRFRRPVTGPLPDGLALPDTAAWLERAGLRHVIRCPLLVEREVVGLLSLARRRSEPFTEADLAALQPFATLAALLLRDARLLADARQAGEAKTTFLNLAAHELRTPLAVIRGYLSLLEDGTYPVPDRTREEAVDTLVRKAQELESLVETLVTAARLEGGSLPRSIAPLDVAQAVREAVERVRPRARLEGAQIDVRAPECDVVARADGGHVARILDNLLNNALTYSESPASVTVELRPRNPVEVAVRDLGQGIPPDHHDRVFERFHRVDGVAYRPGAGLGLGLSISRELARLNGGALELERSAPGRGSVFVLRLPARGAPG